jgi:hypothetical protein
MAHLEAMLQTHPRSTSLDRSALLDCIRACFECAETCTSCADACLGEPEVGDLVRCIRLNIDCADVCATTGRMLLRLTEADPTVLRAQLEACIAACRVCGEECERHAGHMEHCRVCADSCRRCAEACQRLLQTLAA